MEMLRSRLVALLAAAAIALTLAACGDDDDADQIRDQVESSVDDLKQEGEDLRKDIEENGSREELQKKVDE
jgi:ABC-type transporter MlaC component